VEICKIKIAKDTLQMLVDSTAITTEDFEVIGVDEANYDYTANPIWLAAKEKSDKSFKELKKIEWQIRNK
jgi:hypothetical protein